jgi:hypothetical protein
MFEVDRLKSLPECRGNLLNWRFLPFSLFFNIVIFIILFVVTISHVVLRLYHSRLSCLFEFFFGKGWNVLLDKDMLGYLVGE